MYRKIIDDTQQPLFLKFARLPYQITFICFVILAVYYPAISAEISLIDDLGMISDILNSENFSLKDVFIPRSAGGGYYRPVIGLTYYFDYYMWNMSSSFMHLENILLHIGNMLMVFLIARLISVHYLPERLDALPILSALMFALHPIATESVNWISGRTDLLSGFFVLISAYMLLRYRFYHSYYSLFGSILSLGIALLAKEVAFGFILAIPFFLKSSDTTKSEEPTTDSLFSHPSVQIIIFSSITIVLVLIGVSFWVMPLAGLCFVLVMRKKAIKELKMRQLLIGLATIILLLAGTFVLFFVLRKIAFSSDIDRISNTLRLIYQDTGYAISVFTGAAGFYVKKFFLPLPLNFFIREIDPLYDLVGIVLFLSGIYLILKRDVISLLSIAGVCLFLPALPFAFGTIAWTGYAERYIYISSAFWSIATLAIILSIRQTDVVKKTIHTFLFVLFSAMLFVTFQRNLTWQTNMALITDTVTKSPHQKELRGLYMLALIRSGDLKLAREQYSIASSLRSNKYLESYDVNMAGIEATEGNKVEAERLLKKVLIDTKGKSATALKFYVKFLENELKNAKNPTDILLLQNKIIPLYKQLYEVNHDPFIYYRLGQIYIARNEHDKALEMFERVVKEYPAGNMYRENAAKIMLKLNNHNGDSKAKGVSL